MLKTATMLLLAVLMLNPELAQLALFIDAIGLELFIMLLQAQLLTFALGNISSSAVLSWQKLTGALRSDGFSLIGIQQCNAAILLPILVLFFLSGNAAVHF